MALARRQEWGQTQSPHWMRLLEEKYQRLHAKIVNQTARFSHRRRNSLAATRVLRESQQQRKHTSCSRVNTGDQDVLGNDQELIGAETTLAIGAAARQHKEERLRFDHENTSREEINGAVISSDCPQTDLRSKTAKSLSKCVIKQSSDHSINPRSQTQLGTRSSVFNDSCDSEQPGQALDNSRNDTKNYYTDSNNLNNNKVTPLSSGVVTRVSSAYPFTRLSSAYCDNTTLPSRPSPRIVISSAENDQEIDAEQLNFVLNLQFENQENEFEEEEDFMFTQILPLEDLVENGQCCSHLSYEDPHDDSMMNVKCHTDRDDVTGRGRRRRRAVTRPVKTSVSRISHKTSKSCPATLLDIQNETDIYNNNNNSNNNLNPIGSILENNILKNDFSSRKNLNVCNGSHSHHHSKPGVSLEPLTAQGVQAGRMRVFARMSLEARHAIDETLKEMKTEERLQQQQQQMMKPVEKDDEPSCVDGSINNINNSADSIQNNYSVKTGDEQPTAEQRLKSTITDVKINPEDGADFSSNVSVASNDSHVYAKNKGLDNIKYNGKKDGIGLVVSRTRPPPYKDSNNNQIHGFSTDSKSNNNTSRRLPQLEENLDTFRDNFPTPHAPLPAIRQMNNNRTFRESTFEITPPDFDIRFREIITCQKGDRETPPLDVRQQSIDKCQQWLVRYTPRR